MSSAAPSFHLFLLKIETKAKKEMDSVEDMTYFDICINAYFLRLK